MLPLLVIVAVVLLQLCTTSPVYNMQPAYITTNISTMGRNIRNLPCISRKSNQSGVCMFAIDCLKANGTHLGTCIDRFYFGSCCHIEPPPHDIIENTIESDIIPARVPPERLSGTIKPILNITSTTTTTPSTTQTPQEEATTVSFKLTTFQTVEVQNTIASTESTSTTVTRTTPTTRRPTIVTNKVTRRTTTTRPTTTRPITARPTTIRPTSPRPTIRPSATRPTRRPSTKPTRKPSTKPSTVVTKKPTSVKPTKKVTTITKPTSPKPSASTTFSTVLTKRPTSAPGTTTPKGSTVVTEFIKNVTLSLANKTSVSEVEGSTSTTQGTIVTWTVLTEEKTTTSSQAANSTSEEWVPIATPDNWVALPSVSPSTTLGWEPNKTSTTTSSPGSIITTESASKTSISYVPLETSTVPSSALNTTIDQKPTVITGTTSAPLVTSTGTSTTSTGTQATSTTTASLDTKPVNMSDFTAVCGRRMFPEARIVGGEKSSFGKWPWQISLRQWRTSTYLHKCGAALLNENWAITAAHCVDNVPPSDLLLRLGEHDLSTESEPYLHQERRVQIVASHPQFDPRTFEYDLALLRFYEPVTFQPNILPVCVPQSDENFVGRTAYVTGWGRLYEDGPLPSVLQEVSVPVINNSVCESMYRSAGYIEHIPHIFICAGWRRGGFDSCEGDSGGPMVIQREDKRYLLAGVISWGIGCAEPNQPGVYTRISEFRDWINQILQF